MTGLRRAKCFMLALAAVMMIRLNQAQSAEVVRLDADHWDEYVPSGKEVDAIHGDYVLRNEVIVAVIADPVPSRNANMTVRGVGGSVIDITRRDAPNDQLSAFYPTARGFTFAADAAVAKTDNGVELRLNAAAEKGKPQVDLIYGLSDEDAFLRIETRFTNVHSEAITVPLQDSMRADRSFKFDFSPSTGLFWAHDEWWRQAYGVVSPDHTVEPVPDSVGRGRPFLSYASAGKTSVEIPPGESHVLTRLLIPAPGRLQLHGLTLELLQRTTQSVQLDVIDSEAPVELAKVSVFQGDALLGESRTGGNGRIRFRIPSGGYRLTVDADGRPRLETSLTVDGPTRQTLNMARPGHVVAQILDEAGQPIPCKVEFKGKDGTPDPFFGPDCFVYGVHNLRYTPDGRFRQPLGPGEYDVIISRGNEYDAVFTSVVVTAGQDSSLTATLRRTVDTAGWISSDFHSHSSPSGDNTSSQRGRVLNLLSEHIEFAPCTEHNRVSTYVPHLAYFNAESRMATCSGMELTGQPLPVNHQNAFPVRYYPRTQDGGGPQTDENPLVQIERLAFWDHRAQKVVQGNHPNLLQVLNDKDLDGKPDGGFARMLGLMDVIEVHPPEMILNTSAPSAQRRSRGNVIFNWLQMLNQGYRIPGVVNTDAHYNFHGSGWLRNYLKSDTDDPAKLKLANVVRTTERGNIVMTNGPFLETSVASVSAEKPLTGYPGDDLLADGGKVTVRIRVQCANWLDVNRVQIFLNGVPVPELNYTRRTHAARFRDKVVKFDEEIPLTLKADAHIIVVAAGEDLKLGPVVGPQHGNDTPVAVSNPVFIDVDANGFQPNADLLGHPLEVGN